MNMSTSNASRRTVAAGIAWSVPAVAAATAVPAFAASPPPGLNGWVTIWREQRGYYDSYGYWRNTSCVVVYDGRGSGTGPDGYPYGFYVWDVDDPAKLTAPPRVTITLPYRVTWSYGTGNTDWKLVSSSGTTYVFEYQGSYTVGTLNGKPAVFLSGRPHFRGTVSGACPQDNSQTIERCAQVNDKDLCFPRSVPFPTQWVQVYGAQNVQPMSAEDAAPAGRDPSRLRIGRDRRGRSSPAEGGSHLLRKGSDLTLSTDT